ncbi:MAG: sugar ABC transporter permease [Anaerolineaceae bacterium]|nr:sugar ABC transporter permease [Anaerolineaceae bacterium]
MAITNQFIKKRKWGDLPAAFFFLFPSLVLIIIFSFYPMAQTIRLSLFKWNNVASEPVFIGLKNYIYLFSSDRFWNSIQVTFTYTFVVTAVSVLGGLLLAVVLNHPKLVLTSFWRVLYFLPTVTPTVAAAMVWILLFNPNYGFINSFLRNFDILGPNWLSSTSWALPTVMTLGIWRRIGFTVIVYLAALQAIPKDYYESASMDGANAWNLFRFITLPLVAPTTVMLVILGMIDSFNVFDSVLVMTRGGPSGATEVLGQYLYSDAFTLFKMGLGSAIAVIILIITASVTIFQWRVVGLGSYEEQ